MIARKRFGQHFLEPAWVIKVIDAIAPRPDDRFFEIGPGRGALTHPLAERTAQVTAFEIDRDLAAVLRHNAPSNLEIVEGDFLDSRRPFDVPATPPIRVAGNLPYNVASPILFKLIDLYEAGVPMTDATLMLQREVADRLVARPGTKEYGALSVFVRLSAAVERLLALPPGAFRPAPKVQTVFTRRRKTLENALLAFAPHGRPSVQKALNAAELDGRRRPETLDIVEFVRLSDAFLGRT